jgi:hypothetical protein
VVINLFPILILLAGWCFFDRQGLGATALALAVIGIMTGGSSNDGTH